MHLCKIGMERKLKECILLKKKYKINKISKI